MNAPTAGDLAAELAAHARDDVRPTGAPGATARLVAVRRRAEVRNRRRAGTVLVVVAVLAFAASVLPKPWLSDDPPTAGRSTQVSVFPAFDGDDPVLASAVGRVGQATVELRFTPTDINLRLDFFCRGDDRSTTASTLSVNGHELGGTSCGDGGTAGFSHSDDAGKNRAGFEADGVRVGHASVLRLTYDGAESRHVRLGMGVYELTGPSTMVGGKPVRSAISLEGKQYLLRAYSAVELDKGLRQATLPGRYGNDLAVCFGSTGGHGIDHLLIDGRPAGGYTSGGFGCQPLDPGTNRTIGARSAKGATGTLVLALYTLRPA